MKLIIQISVVLVMSVMIYGCYRHNEETSFPGASLPGSATCDTSHVSYDSTVSKIFIQNCALPGCHASSAPTGGYTLDNYNGVKSIVLSGRIIGAINHRTGYAFMPKDRAKLSDCNIALITSWINQGAMNN